MESLPVDPFSTHVNDFIWSEEEWPAVSHDIFDDDAPVISLPVGKETSGYTEACKEMVDACSKWGFFKLVGHGVPLEIMKCMQQQCSELFLLPMDQKLQGGRTSCMPLGYSASNPEYGSNLPWAEIVQLLHSPAQIAAFAQKVYGDHHQPLNDAIIMYLNEMDALGMTVLQMLANGLGLEDDYFTRSFKEKESAMIRVNEYPPCPLPERCLGLGSHSDPHTLTILLQDQVGGFQVHKGDGEWVGIKPIPNSFLVNVGDTLEAWTNGRLKSVVHRAVVNRDTKRLSVAYFMSPATETLIDCPSELLDEGSSRRYTAFKWGEFRRELLSQRRVVGKTALNRYLINQHPKC